MRSIIQNIVGDEADVALMDLTTKIARMLRTSRPVVTAGAIAGSAHTDPYDTFAPLSPGEETQLPMDPEFRDACYELMRDSAKKWFFGTEFFQHLTNGQRYFELISPTLNGTPPPGNGACPPSFIEWFAPQKRGGLDQYYGGVWTTNRATSPARPIAGSFMAQPRART